MSKQHIRGGLLFDGTGAPGVSRDLLIEGGRVRAILEPGRAVEGAEVIDASGAWVCPGFLDLHTHYDAEVEVLPGLSESVRHGVTSVVFGSCGLSMAVGDPVDLADMFCRVEGIPRETVLPILQARKTWDSPAAYLAHLRTLPLGPNVACLLGHSTIRAHVMGIERSLTRGVAPTGAETRAMQWLLEESLDAGMLGLSVNTLTWDKMDGDETRPYRSRPTPSTYARWSEYRSLTRILRRRGRIFQGVPNVSTKWNVAMFFLESLGVVRPGLKTMLISMMDAKAARMPFRLVGALSRFVNGFLGAHMRFQSLPNVFDLWIDGLEAPVFEEVGAGTEALTLKGDARTTLLRDPAFRRRFKRQWANVLFGRAFHRDLADTEILECPDDPSLVGKSFADVARKRKVGHVDAFLDVVAEHGDALRWYTVVGNDRPRWLRWIAAHPAVLVGFSDAGAHLRNMAHYNFPLRLLKMVRDAELAGRPFMSVERAVHRVTGELAEYLGLDAGHLAEGKRADVVVLDPHGLTDDVERIVEREMEGFGGLRRLVRRNDDAVRAVLVGGRKVVENGEPLPSLGQTRAGAVLTATTC